MSNLEIFHNPSDGFNRESLNISPSESLPYGPSILPDGATFFNYPNVDSNISKISIIFTKLNGKKLSEVPCENTSFAPSLVNSFSLIMHDTPSPYYKLSIEYKDGRKETCVDPAAKFLPNGVLLQNSPRAVGQIVNQDSYCFIYPRPEPKENMLISQIHVGTRTPEGTFNALIENGVIKRLAARGFDAIKFLPLMAVPGEWNWGYDGTAHSYSISQNYGTIDDFKKVVDEAHKYGMRVIMDFVFNHFSTDIESQSYLFGNDVLKATKNDWSHDINFNNPGLREFDIRSVEYFLSTCNIDGIRLDAARILPNDFVEDVICRAKVVNPNVSVIYEGYLEPYHTLRGHKNIYDYSHGNMLWLAALLLPEDLRYAWYLKLNNDFKNTEDKISYVAQELTCNDKTLSNFGINHDAYGNIAPYNRLPQQMILAHGEDLGLAACRLFLSVCLTTPGNMVIFNGDEEGILTSPFPFFQKRLSEEEQKRVMLNRLREWGRALVHNEHDYNHLHVFKENCSEDEYNWDGSVEQLKEKLDAGLICQETYDNLTNFVPGDPSTFKKAIIKQEDLTSEISQQWRNSFDLIVNFNKTITPRKRVFPATNTKGDRNLLIFENMELLGSKNPIVGFANPTTSPQQFNFEENGFYYGGKIIFHSNQGASNVNFPTFTDDILTIPPFCMVYLEIPKD